MNVHEEEFIRAFIVPNKRDRYLSLLGTKRGRRKLTDRLNHNHDLDSQHLHKIAPSMHSTSSVLGLLKQRYAPSACYVISANHDIDGQEMELKSALLETIGQGFGTVISCIPGELGYFEAEDPGERHLLFGPSNRRAKSVGRVK